MTQKKRGSGRVTPAKKARATESAEVDNPARPRPGLARRTVHDRAPEASSRYTPPKAAYRVRPRWHRVVGWLGVVMGILIAVLNDGMYITEAKMLPFGHSELYLMLALSVSGSSSWFLGVFDHGTTIYD